MPSRVLVTGGTGFIGSHLVKRLSSQGHQVRVMSRRCQASPPGSGEVEFLPGDFTREDDVGRAVRGIRIVYHLAATTIPGDANRRILFDARTNLIGSLQLIQAASEAGVRRFVFVSSGGAVYGRRARRPVDERGRTDPISAHAVSKLAIEKYLRIFGRRGGMTWRVARGANPYGEGQDPSRGQGFVAYALGRMARGEPITIWGDGDVVRDFIYIGDFVEALALLARDHGPFTLYNVGAGEGRSLIEIVSMLEKVTGRRALVEFTPGREADVPYSCLDIGRIRTALGWAPAVPLEEGLARTWAWISALPSLRPGISARVPPA